MEKKEKNIEKHWISFRVQPEEYNQIHKHFASTTCRKLSDYARRVLLQKPVVVRYRNQSADEFLSAMIPLKNDLNALGNNFNQAVKKLHTLSQIHEYKAWILTYELDKKRLLEKVDEIKFQIQQIYDKWLQE
ncbi:plasmid mobilization relaxosome protein MobC [Segetibacter sp. 3557_3]|uniref:plasmid mobilization protein n=1 Tax=Segetibacter sp. 3557_3 TaxID=2547429 RepID=UPI001058A756|nr:plasmid mobilization relaxosome protein MobC [Segetibacter sp. 3557_3]TDH17781.1 plasmid mobilization relaxosome protein MobC [Segetibacter sp. 3557_3]